MYNIDVVKLLQAKLQAAVFVSDTANFQQEKLCVLTILIFSSNFCIYLTKNCRQENFPTIFQQPKI